MELKVRQKATHSNTLTFDNVKTYAEITGDYNPCISMRVLPARPNSKH